MNQKLPFGKWLVMMLLVLAGSGASAQTVAVTNLSLGPFCPGATAVANFATTNAGAATASINLTAILSNSDGVTYPGTPVVLGATMMVVPTGAGTGSISITIPFGMTASPTYTLMITSSFANSLPSVPFQIYATPVITNVTPLPICSGTGPNITLTSNVPSTFTWASPTVVGSVTGSAPSGGNATVINQTLTNAGNAPGTVSYPVVATSDMANGSCVGPSTPLVVTVNPVASVNAVAGQIVCSSAPVAAVNFSSPATGGTVAFNWTNSNTATGLGANGAGNIAAFNASANATNTPVTGVVSVTPVYTNAGGGAACSGTAANNLFSITVNPAATVSVSNQNQIVCSGGAVAAIGFGTSATGGTTTYTWTATNAAGTGIGASGSGNIAAFSAAANAGTSPQVSNGSVTPSFMNTSGGPSCPGTAGTFSLNVNPVPAVSSVTNQNQIVCSAGAVSAIGFNTTATGGTTTFAWTATNSAGTGIGASGSGNVAAFTAAANAGTSPQLSNGTVTPSFVNAGGGPTCPGTTNSFSLRVNPVTVVSSITNQNQIVCSAGAVAGIGFSTTATGGTTTFNWTATNAAGTGIAASGAGNIPGFTAAANATTAPQVSNGTVTPGFVNTSGGPSCPGTGGTFSLTVNPAATVSISNQNQIVCSGGAVAAIGFGTSATGGTTTYAWTATNAAGTGIGASGSGNVAAFSAAANAGTSPQVSNGSVTPSFMNTSGGPACPGTAGTFSLNVNPVPAVSSVTNQNQIVCSAGAVSAIGFNTTATGGTTTFAWTATNSAGTGIGASGSGNVAAFTAAANAGTSPQLSNGTVTPSFVNAGGGPTCPGTAGAFTLNVNPVVIVSSVTNQNQTVCGSAPVAGINFSSTATGGTTTFAWTATNAAGTGIGASGNGNIAAFNAAANNGTTAQVSNGSVTPSFTNTSGGPACPGTANNFSLTVNPIPQYNGPGNLSICSGTSTNIALTANTTGGVNTFAWTLGANTGVIGPLPGSGGTISQTLANLGTSVAFIVYNVTPTFTNNLVSCSGGAASVINNVNPIPTYNGPLSTTVCSGIMTNVVLSSNTTPSANNSFSWTLGTNTGGITGATASSGTTIAQMLTNPSPTIPGSIVYNVTPTFTAGGTPCSGSAAAVTANVNPKPFYTGPTNISICSGTNTNLTLQASTPSSFAWTLGTITGGITGAFASNGPTISQTLGNPLNTVGSVIYNVTPTATAGGGCAGTATPVTVNVNPIPAYNGPTNPAAICSGVSPNVLLSATSAAALNNSFAWTIGANPGGVTGASPGSGGTIAQALTNPSTTTAATITYNVTPTFTAGGTSCPAASSTAVNVTVNPLGTVLPASGSQSICSGTNPNIILSSSAGAATFTWTVSNVSPLISGASNNSGAIINQPLTNSSNSSSGTVQYNVTAVTGAGCAGGTASYIIQVNPIPHLTAPTPTSRTICSGDNTAITLVATTGGPNSFAWTLLGGTNITGKSASGGGSISQTLTNTGNQFSDSVFYLVTTISPVSCSNAIPDTIKVVVNPKPVLTTIAPVTICSESSINISLGASAPSNFVWSVSPPPKITNASPGSGSVINQTLNNTDVTLPPGVPSSGTVIYSIKPTSLAGCVGRADTALVTVNPLPVVVFTTGTSKTICSGTLTSIPLSANLASSFTYTTATITSLALITGQSANGGSTINQTLINSSDSVADSIAYSVIPTTTSGSPTCVGKPSTVVVRVNPKPALTSALTDSVCSGATTTTLLTATIPSTYAWSIGTVTGNITGQSANPTSSAVTTIGQQLVNPSFTAAGFVEYIVTPTSASLPNCTGAPKTITVKVNPSPKLTSDSARAICSNDILNYTPTSSVTAGSSIFKYDRTSAVPTIANQFQKITTGISDTLFTAFILSPAIVDYNFTLTSSAGCSLGNQHLKVTVNPRPDTPGIAIFPRTKLCSGATAMNFSASRTPDPREYFRWSTSNAGTPIQKLDSSFSQNSLISFPNAGNATVTVESISRGFGCVSRPSNKQLPVASAGGNEGINVVLFANNIVAQVTGAKAYQWGFDRKSDLDSTMLNGETTQSYDTRRGFNTTANFYWVMVTFPDDCVQKAYYNNVALGIQPQTVQAAEVKIYPNPVQDVLTLELMQANTAGLVYEVYDLAGKRIAQVNSNTAKTRITVSEFAPGYYTVACSQNGLRIATNRFIKN